VEGLLAGLFDAGAAPIRTSRGVLFVAPAFAGEPWPEVRGTFTNWEASEATVLQPIAGMLHGRYVDAAGDWAEYKVVFNQGAAWFTDPSSRHIEWDGINPNDVGAFNSVVVPEQADAKRHRTVWLKGVQSSRLQNARDVYVHLPPSYDASPERRYPVLYMHDGNESIVRGQFHEVVEEWTQRTSNEIIVVFVALPNQNIRIAEYTMATPEARGVDYAHFVAEELRPLVDAEFRTITEKAARGVGGASLGGLISWEIVGRYPEVFEYALGMSSSFWWENQWMVGEMDRRGCQGVTYYLDSGSPNDGVDGTRAMRDELVQLGCEHVHVEEPGGQHDWSFWKRRLPGALDVFQRVYAKTMME